MKSAKLSPEFDYRRAIALLTPIRPSSGCSRCRAAGRPACRRGAASLDLVLVVGVVLPLLAFVFWAAPRIMYLVYQMIAMLVSWPFM